MRPCPLERAEARLRAVAPAAVGHMSRRSTEVAARSIASEARTGPEARVASWVRSWLLAPHAEHECRGVSVALEPRRAIADGIALYRIVGEEQPLVRHDLVDHSDQNVSTGGGLVAIEPKPIPAPDSAPAPALPPPLDTVADVVGLNRLTCVSCPPLVGSDAGANPGVSMHLHIHSPPSRPR